jgi:alpha-glucosidase (family GH31 glycosyl hydrolase)
MFENNQTGAPLMRPIFFEEADNLQLATYSDVYLWGRDVLVAPVLNAGEKTKEVYFTNTSNWYDFYSDEKFKGGQTKTVQIKENSIPTYIRGGAIIPMSRTVQSTKEYDANNIIIHYYFDPSVIESEREFYNDDGKTVNAFEKGMYEILEIEAELEGNWLEIEMEAEIGKQFEAQDKTISLVIHNIQEMPKRIKIGKEKTNGTYQSKKKTLVLSFTWNTSEEKEIKIKLE